MSFLRKYDVLFKYLTYSCCKGAVCVI